MMGKTVFERRESGRYTDQLNVGDTSRARRQTSCLRLNNVHRCSFRPGHRRMYPVPCHVGSKD